ncbi:MAG: hypothetical protein L0154_28850 [Chloroflexi bacterium]|nr:hypothetical protein [Chloroflexota bacterium]
MRFIFRITLLIFFISLNLLSLQLLNLRVLPSEAYWISFKVWDTNPGAVFVMHPDGSNQRFVAHLDHVGNSNILEWSADGQSLYFFRWSVQGVFSVNPAGRQLKKIVEGNVCRDHVTFSPNNEWLIVALEKDERQSLFRLRPDGSHAEEIYQMGSSCAYPVWSPDGQWLAMMTHNGGVNGRTVIVRMTPDGNNLEVLAPPPDHYLIPAWSPDGNWIGYIAYTFEGDEQTMGAYIMRADGSDKLMLSAGMKHASFADWSPDSEWILFAGHDPIQGYASAIFKIKRDGTQLQQTLYVKLKSHLSIPLKRLNVDAKACAQDALE